MIDTRRPKISRVDSKRQTGGRQRGSPDASNARFTASTLTLGFSEHPKLTAFRMLSDQCPHEGFFFPSSRERPDALGIRPQRG
jgi:hypothetical protein